MTTRDLPKYKCHKEVRAFKIGQIAPAADSCPSDCLLIEDAKNNKWYALVDKDYIDKHKPEVGGYYVQYEDGYQSYSPAKAFEDGYTLMESKDDPVVEWAKDAGEAMAEAEKILNKEIRTTESLTLPNGFCSNPDLPGIVPGNIKQMKPNSGFIPRKLHYEQRYLNLAAVIESYLKSGKPVPTELSEELCDILTIELSEE